MNQVRDLLDRQLGKVTMYRLVTLTLGLLVAVYALFTATGVIEGLSTGDNLLALLVLVAASVVANRLLGLVWRLKPHTESAVITALLLFFIFVPLETSVANLVWLGAAAVLANASKYLLAWRGRHVLNPAAAGAFLVVVAQDVVGRETSIFPIWQTAATEALTPFLTVAALLVLWRTRRLDVGLAFAVVAYVLVLVGLTAGFGTPLSDAWQTALYSYPVVFIAGYMVTEPLTLPPRRVQQLVVAVVTAAFFAYPTFTSALGPDPVTIGSYSMTPEIAILVGNLVAFAFARRAGLRLELVESRDQGLETRELVFRSTRPTRFVPGQYAELHVPHRKVDQRGTRRVFSIASAPSADTVSFALRVPPEASSFKRALGDLEPGDVVHSTGVGGDFCLPRDRSVPVVLVAGGIGVTPFLSQLGEHPDRDAVLVYGLPSGETVPFSDALAARRVVIVSPSRPSSMPEAWTWVEAPLLSADVVAHAVPDLATRRAYVSGPPLMVNAVRPGLKKTAKKVHTDYFSGY